MNDLPTKHQGPAAEPPSPKSSAREGRRSPKWHLIYYVLAIFDLATIGGSVFLSREVMAIYRNSVEVNQRWAGQLAAVTALVQYAGAVNAPGNDIFDSHDVELEERRQKAARKEYERHFAQLREDVARVATGQQARDVQARLDDIQAAMGDMLAEVDSIFAFFRVGDAENAGRRMATMDRKFASLSTAIMAAAQSMRAVQSGLFKEQVREAGFLGRFEYLFGGIILLMVVCVTIYGHKIASEFKRGENERARYLSELEDKEEALRLRVAELSDAMGVLARQSRQLEDMSAQLNRSLVESRSVNSAKSDFLARMSQELRAPLNAIIGFSETMKEGVLGPIENPRYREYASDIYDSGQHLLAIINDILDLSKIDAGKAEPRDENCRLDDIADAALRLVRARAQEGGVTIDVAIPARLPAMRADARALKQILVNLLTNAVKFTPAGGRVNVRAAVKPGAGMCVTVSDTGVGRRPEDIEVALTAFGQVRNPMMKAHEDTGIGLPIAASLMRLHGGSLDIDSAAGRGTTVTLTFPAERLIKQESGRARELA